MNIFLRCTQFVYSGIIVLLALLESAATKTPDTTFPSCMIRFMASRCI
jgi:hypothetical protein